MKKIITLSLLFFIALTTIFIFNTKKSDIVILQNKHAYFLKNSPFEKTKHLTKKERKALGIPGKKYYEYEWEVNMNPALGRPTPENLYQIHKDILDGKYNYDLSYNKSVPGEPENFWTERGPNNIGGRTKAVIFDPNDITKETIYAGGVSGGLWKNTNISIANSPWNLVNLPSHLNVSSITFNPLNTNEIYVGTGESYTSGDGIGSGVWKSSDAGTTWTDVFGGFEGAAQYQSDALVQINSPSSIAGNYAAIQASFGPTLTEITANLVLVNDGTLTPTLGCSTLSNATEINGKIAVIERGDCTFVEKVTNAQNAGAIGVIMINNVSGPPIPQGGTDSSITIPSVMISRADGLTLMNALSLGAVNATLNPHQSIGNGIFLIPGKSHINDLIAVNNNGSSEIYAAVGDSYYGGTLSPLTVFGAGDVGVYKSVDGGINWTKLNMPSTSTGDFYVPIDLEYGTDNTLWTSTTNSVITGEGGGAILSSSDHSSFTLKHTITDGLRVEIAISKTNANKLYFVSMINNTTTPVKLYKTLDQFANVTQITNPVSGYSGIPAKDFTNGQGWYDLAIDVNPTNDDTVYVGGIDWFKTVNGGTSWSQITAGYGGAGSYIHPDQHGIAFGDSNKILLGCDGGVAYSPNGGGTFEHRNSNYNVTQFYYMGVAPTNLYTGDYFIAGAQDNGTQKFENAPDGIGSSTQAQGGDGGYCFYDQYVDKYYVSNYVYNQNIQLFNYNTGLVVSVNNETYENGDFINQQTLDSRLNFLYTNYTSYNSTTQTYTYQFMRYKFTAITGAGYIQKTKLTNALMTSSPTAFKVSPYTTTSSTLLIGLKNGKLLKLTNANTVSLAASTAGTGWSDLTSSEFVGSISDIEFGTSEQEIFVTFSNFGVQSIWYTSNGGTTWSAKEGNLPDIPVKTILQNPLRTEQVLIGTELGTWATYNFFDSNPQWYYVGDGMNSVKVTDLELRNDNKVFASTYGRGIFSGQFTAADGTVGVDENELNAISSLYPNPVKDFSVLQTNIEFTNPTIRIYSTTGQLVKEYKYKTTHAKFKFSTEGIKSGIYTVQINSNEKSYSTKLIVQ